MHPFYLIKIAPEELASYMFQDCIKNPSVTIIDKLLPFSGKINRLIGDAATRFLDVSIFQFFFSLLLIFLNPLKKIKNTTEQIILLFLNVPTRELTPFYLKRFLKKHPNCTPVMLFTDPVDSYMSRYAKRITEQIPQFICMTYDPTDAIKYGYHHTMSVYSTYSFEKSFPQYDLYFSFSGMNRLEMVQGITDYLLQNNVNPNIIIAGEPAHEEYIKKRTRGIHFLKSRKSYKEVLDDVNKANCLLEILQEGHSGATLRYYEAICYNKKLLTNNKNIINLPFYNPDYMRIFEKPEDIDCEWLKKSEDISYEYDGRFSPLHLLEEIENLINHE